METRSRICSWIARWLLASSFALVLLLVGNRARADDQDDARKHFESGIALISAEPHDYSAALVEFQASVSLYPTKAGLFNLGLCYSKLSRYGEALDTFDRLEKEFGRNLDDAMKADVERERAAIRERSSELTIAVSQPGATVRLDGVVVGKSPVAAALVLPAREHYLEVEMPGFEAVRRKLALGRGQQRTETVQLVPLAGKLMITAGSVVGAVISVDGKGAGVTPLAAPLSLAAGEHDVGVAKAGYQTAANKKVFLLGGQLATLDFPLSPIPPPPAKRVLPTRERDRTLVTAGWISGGLAATSAVFGGLFWFEADARHDDFNHHNDRIASGDVKAGTPEAAEVSSKRQSAADDTERFGHLAVGFGIGAGVLAATSAVLFVLDAGKEERAPGSISARRGGLAVEF